MGEVFYMNHVGEKEYLGFQDPLSSAEHLFDQPGTGRTPHAIDLYGQAERGRGGFLIWGILRRFSGTYIFSLSGNNAGLQAGLIDFRLPEIGGHPLGTGGENKEYLPAPGAAKAKKFVPHRLFHFRTAQRKAA
jgi:hypothetical protein